MHSASAGAAPAADAPVGDWKRSNSSPVMPVVIAADSVSVLPPLPAVSSSDEDADLEDSSTDTRRSVDSPSLLISSSVGQCTDSPLAGSLADCGCSDHFGRLFLDTTMPCNIDRVHGKLMQPTGAVLCRRSVW